MTDQQETVNCAVCGETTAEKMAHCGFKDCAIADQPSTELLPCPFCGGDARIMERMDENIWDHSEVKWVSVSCQGECENAGFDWPEHAKPNAIELWNTRPAPVVKDLVWEAEDEGSRVWDADGLGKAYRVIQRHNGSAVLRPNFNRHNETAHDSFEAAKAAAQADYERRILSALTHAPITPAQAAKVLSEAMLNGLDPFDVTENLEMESLAIQYAGNRGDAVVTLEIAEKFMKAALKAIAEEGE